MHCVCSLELSKRDIQLKDRDSVTLQCTLWGEEAEQFVHNGGAVGAVLAIKSGRLSDFNSAYWDEPKDSICGGMFVSFFFPTSFSLSSFFLAQTALCRSRATAPCSSTPTLRRRMSSRAGKSVMFHGNLELGAGHGADYISGGQPCLLILLFLRLFILKLSSFSSFILFSVFLVCLVS